MGMNGALAVVDPDEYQEMRSYIVMNSKLKKVK